jgi:hypothetical protein
LPDYIWQVSCAAHFPKYAAGRQPNVTADRIVKAEPHGAVARLKFVAN